jgi:acyl-coenzyme A synthetase/AMP-(fatty) acid ligase
MKMPRNNTASLWSAIIASGNLSSHLWAGPEANASWGELAQASILESRPGELRNQSVLIATLHQFSSIAALIELDGIARRIVLYPHDLSKEHIQYVAETADVDFVVTDRPDMASLLPQSCRLVRSGRAIVPANIDRGNPIETEWILLTSGTTGHPKLVLHTYATLAGDIDRADPVVWATFYDMRRYGGLSIFLRALVTGSSLVLRAPQESSPDLVARAALHGVTHFSGTPSHWRSVLMSSAAELMRPQNVRMSGEIADQAILNHVQQQYPQATVTHAFASTEAGVVFEVNDGLMGVPAEIIESSSRVELKVKNRTLRIRSRRAALRYLDKGSPSLKDDDGFVDSGDELELRDGRYYFAGRRDGTINVGGFKVHPEEVEAAINRHPEVAMSLVKAKKSPITGALVIADVVLRLPQSGSSNSVAVQSDILRFCRRELAPHMVPTAINSVPMLAIGEAGKMVRRNA